jgi:hypothetical protein
MKRYKFTDVEYHFVQNKELLAQLYSHFEISFRHTGLFLYLPFNLTADNFPMINLEVG